MVAPVSVVPPGMRYYFYFTIFLGRGSFSGFHLASPTIVVLIPQVKELVAEDIYFNHAFWK